MNTELIRLKKIVESTLELDMNKYTRKADYMHARIIYSCIAHEYVKNNKNRLTLADIAEPIGKDHATIVHYRKTIKYRMKDTPKFRIKYDLCLENFLENKITVHDPTIEPQKIRKAKRVKQKIEPLGYQSEPIEETQDEHILKILSLSEANYQMLVETRLIPFFKMLESRKTYDDILSKRKKSQYI